MVKLIDRILGRGEDDSDEGCGGGCVFDEDIPTHLDVERSRVYNALNKYGKCRILNKTDVSLLQRKRIVECECENCDNTKTVWKTLGRVDTDMTLEEIMVDEDDK